MSKSKSRISTLAAHSTSEKDICGRVIGISKYERDDPEIRKWWLKLFDVLEKESAIPPDRKEEVLREILPDKLLERILCKLSFIKAESPAKPKKSKSSSSSLSYDGEGTPCDSETKIIPSLDRLDPPSQHHVIPTRQVASHVPSDLKEEMKRRRVGHDNPYLRFFGRQHPAVWRPLPPLSLEEMNLTQKAEAITEMIAADFVEWMKTIGGQQDLTVETVTKMFEIGFNTHAAHSLAVKMVEMPAIPEQVALSMDVPELSRRQVLHKLIQGDIAAAKKKPLTVAFGRSLPMDMQVKPTKDDIAKKWLYCDKVPEKLESMAAVWEGITHLRSTREFCEYLIEHPLTRPPQYLVESKMLNPQYLHRVHRSLDSAEISAGSELSIPFGLEEGEKKEG